MPREQLQERQNPVPNNTPVERGENIQDRASPRDWRDPMEGVELIPPQVEGQR
ncbi:hypothetical protein [Pseudomonas subflava]|uniref:hypothetical protein n=1 Tax=Pseudomonas subflava TaxID=2952933 RepID=UPI0020797B21|nr:hypothetical protein [Pseudomonas subflava]